MISKPIPIIRAKYLNLVLKVLDKSSVDYEKHLQQYHLPTNLVEHQDAYVPAKAISSLIHWATVGTNVKDLGLRAASGLSIDDINAQLVSVLQSATSLDTALQEMCRLAELEQSAVRYQIIRVRTKDSDKVQIRCSADSLGHSSVDSDMEWFTIMLLVTMIRYFAGNAWSPTIIALQAQNPAGQYARGIFPNTQFYSAQKESGIEFPASLLSTCAAKSKLRPTASIRPDANTQRPVEVTWDFPTSLQKLLQVYLDERYPDIKLAAKIVGSSVRTLQRRLWEHNLSYSELVHQTQILCAKELLTNNELRTLDVAYAVGYKDPSNFARAFRRIAGLSPRQYRHQFAH